MQKTEQHSQKETFQAVIPFYFFMVIMSLACSSWQSFQVCCTRRSFSLAFRLCSLDFYHSLCISFINLWSMDSSQARCSIYLKGQLFTDHKLRKQMSEVQKVLILGSYQISLELLSEHGTNISHICQFLFLNALNTIKHVLAMHFSFIFPHVIAFLCTLKTSCKHA